MRNNLADAFFEIGIRPSERMLTGANSDIQVRPAGVDITVQEISK